VNRGLKLIYLLKQRLYKIVNYINQVLFLTCSFEGLIDSINTNLLKLFNGMLSVGMSVGFYSKKHSLLFKQYKYFQSILIGIPIDSYIKKVVELCSNFTTYFKGSILKLFNQEPSRTVWNYYQDVYTK